MGYDYAHWLAVDPGGEDVQEIIGAVESDEEMALAFGWPELKDAAAERSAEGRQLYGDAPLVFADGENSWDRFEEELGDLSRRFPKALFTITTEGKDFADFPYRRYFRAGGVQTVPCAFPPFDPAKLDRPGGEHDGTASEEVA